MSFVILESDCDTYETCIIATDQELVKIYVTSSCVSGSPVWCGKIVELVQKPNYEVSSENLYYQVAGV